MFIIDAGSLAQPNNRVKVKSDGKAYFHHCKYQSIFKVAYQYISKNL
jgi:hypothetical protein